MSATIPILILACTTASFIQRVSGFGFGIFIMTILPFIMPSYAEATTLSGILSAAQSLIVVMRMWHLVSWRRLWPILTAFIVFSFFAVHFVAMVDSAFLRRVLGVVLIVISIYFFFVSERIHVRPTLGIQLSMGSLSGIMGGLFAMQGPPAVLYFVASERDKETYLAMTQVYFFVGNIFMTFVRAGEGFFTQAVGVSFLFAFVGIFLGTFLGKLVFDRLPIAVLRKVIYAYMAVSGVVAVV